MFNQIYIMYSLKILIQNLIQNPMFLSKKNAAYLNKPKEKITTQRVLPGWADDEEEEIQTSFQPQYSTQTHQNHNLLDDESLKSPETMPNPKSKEQVRKNYFDFDELNDMNNIQFEKKLVQNIVEPGGIRIKPNDNLLNDFLKESKGMEVSIVGSLLLSNIQVNYPFQIKAKSLYTIEFLVKKSSSFLNYFKTQSEKLKEFPEPEDNVQNYRKILKNVLNTIGVAFESQSADDNIISFVDPGYNDPKQQSQLRGLMKTGEKQKQSKPKNSSKKFISPSQARKIQNKKSEDTFDLLGTTQNKSNENKNNLGFDDLLLGSIQPPVQQSNQNNEISFDDLLQGKVQQPKKQGGFDFI